MSGLGPHSARTQVCATCVQISTPQALPPLSFSPYNPLLHSLHYLTSEHHYHCHQVPLLGGSKGKWSLITYGTLVCSILLFPLVSPPSIRVHSQCVTVHVVLIKIIPTSSFSSHRLPDSHKVAFPRHRYAVCPGVSLVRGWPTSVQPRSCLDPVVLLVQLGVGPYIVSTQPYAVPQMTASILPVDVRQ